MQLELNGRVVVNNPKMLPPAGRSQPGDQANDRPAWERAKKALLRHAQWAEAGRGVAQIGKEFEQWIARLRNEDLVGRISGDSTVDGSITGLRRRA